MEDGLREQVSGLVLEALANEETKQDVDASAYKEEYIVSILGPTASNDEIRNKINELIAYLNNTLREHRI